MESRQFKTIRGWSLKIFLSKIQVIRAASVGKKKSPTDFTHLSAVVMRLLYVLILCVSRKRNFVQLGVLLRRKNKFLS